MDLYHLYFQPTQLAAHLLGRLPLLRGKPVIQTIPAIAQVKSIDPHLFFGDRVVVISEFARARLASAGLELCAPYPDRGNFFRMAVTHGSGSGV